MDIKDGGPAFPTAIERIDMPRGMSLRDYFASAGLRGMLAHAESAGEINKYAAEFMANEAYILADAMLKAREGK